MNSLHLFAGIGGGILADKILGHRLAGRTCREVEKECGWWQDEPRVRRVVNELPNRMDRTKALGNAQVPVCAAVAFYLLMKRYEE